MQKTATISISQRPAHLPSWIAGSLTAIAATTLVAMLAWSYANGIHIRAATEAENLRAIDSENRSVCASLGAGPQTDRFATCAATLEQVRTNHAQRIAEPSF